MSWASVRMCEGIDLRFGTKSPLALCGTWCAVHVDELESLADDGKNLLTEGDEQKIAAGEEISFGQDESFLTGGNPQSPSELIY